SRMRCLFLVIMLGLSSPLSAEPTEIDDQPPLDLDALLGIEDEEHDASDAKSAEEAEPIEINDPEKSRLERELTSQQAREKLLQAVTEMGDVADRLERARDTSITTQRMQRDIIDKLDILVRFAENQQQQSSSSSSQQQQQQQQQSVPQQQQSQAQQQQSEQQQGTSGENATVSPPGQQPGGTLFDSESSDWGQLPERFRESLLEGASDPFSEMYRRATEAYYQRLAEEASK
ncbi:MAG: hypothetical protein AAGB34_02845, partial [Planctomycetota bacterium]